MRRRELTEFERKYMLHIIIVLYIFLFLIVCARRIAFSFQKSNYTEMTGVITSKYRKNSRHAYSATRRRRHRRVNYNSYLTVQYSVDGKQETIDDFPGNFWESTGDTIRFYITEDGTAVREPVFSSLFPYTFLFICIVVVKKILDSGKIPSIPASKKSEPVGTVIDDYDWIPQGPGNGATRTFPADTAVEAAPVPQPENSAFRLSESESRDPEKPPFDNPSPLKLASDKPEFELYTEDEYKKLKH